VSLSGPGAAKKWDSVMVTVAPHRRSAGLVRMCDLEEEVSKHDVIAEAIFDGTHNMDFRYRAVSILICVRR
jgi:hypothetical protein